MIISRAIAPSPWLLNKMLSAADAAFEADREQALLAKEAAAERRLLRGMVAEADAKRRKKLWGY